MKYGFVIDNRKCIGCHACTTACKAEHDVPVGVNRTWVKQVEKGVFPNTRRLFSVMRCNQCTDAPCVTICPVEALFIRPDGIVDFDKRRCIGCKSCMQACPYDALYIDPNTHTAAKCNYCAHRIDIGLEPACVNVCPEHAIISGNMDDPNSEISQLLAHEPVTVRRPEKGTQPNVFYINGDEASLNPEQTETSNNYFWSAQTRGVGHYAKAAEKFAWSNADVIEALMAQNAAASNKTVPGPRKSIDVLTEGFLKPRRVYDAPDKGILWGWEVPAYVLTKAISTGTFLIFVLAYSLGITNVIAGQWSLGVSLFFLLLTGAFLIKDLDRPDRFLNVLLRPQWKSWLTRGGYAITVFGGLMSLQLLSYIMGWTSLAEIMMWTNVPVAILVSIYTAFLFAQAKGRDFWQNPLLPLHMLAHSTIAGAAILILLRSIDLFEMTFPLTLEIVMLYAILANLIVLIAEFALKHKTADAIKTADMIMRGRYAMMFWVGIVILGNVLPLALIAFTQIGIFHVIAAVLAVVGIYITERIWIEAPQRISLS